MIFQETASDAFKDKRLIEQLKNDIGQMTSEKETFVEDIQCFRIQNESLMANNAQLKFKNSAVKTNLEKINNLQTLTQAKYLKATAEYEALLVTKDKIQLELDQLKNLLKLKESDSNALSKENAKLTKENAGCHKRIMTLENVKGDQHSEITRLRWEISHVQPLCSNNNLMNNMNSSNNAVTLQKECDINLKAFSDMKKKADDMLRERDLERKKSQKQEGKPNDLVAISKRLSWYFVQGVISEQLEIIALHENHIKTLNQEIKQHILEETTLNSTIKKTEKDRNNAIERGIVLEEKLEEAQGKI